MLVIVTLLLGLLGVSSFENYAVITPNQSVITIEEYMDS